GVRPNGNDTMLGDAPPLPPDAASGSGTVTASTIQAALLPGVADASASGQLGLVLAPAVFTLTPPFDPSVLNFTASVDLFVTSVQLHAAPLAGQAVAVSAQSGAFALAASLEFPQTTLDVAVQPGLNTLRLTTSGGVTYTIALTV